MLFRWKSKATCEPCRKCLLPLASDRFTSTVEAQKAHIGHATAFAVSGMYIYVRDPVPL